MCVVPYWCVAWTCGADVCQGLSLPDHAIIGYATALQQRAGGRRDDRLRLCEETVFLIPDYQTRGLDQGPQLQASG